MSKKALSTAQVIINNVVYPIVPNSLNFTEGFGEYTMRASSVGAGKTETIFSENAENKMSKVKFEMYPTAENIESIREWKSNLNENLIEVSDSPSEFSRSFSNACLVNDYEVNIGSDTTISLEWSADPSV